jgi:hypothetical protein
MAVPPGARVMVSLKLRIDMAARDSIEKIIGNLRDPNDPSFVADGLCAIVKELLPSRPPRDPRRPSREEWIVLYRDQRQRLIEFLTKTAKKK